LTPGTDSALASLWLLSPNFEALRGARTIDLLLHYTATETAEQALDWLARERCFGKSCGVLKNCGHRHRYQRERRAVTEMTKGEVCPDDDNIATMGF